jgi:hypothetical protein
MCLYFFAPPRRRAKKFKLSNAAGEKKNTIVEGGSMGWEINANREEPWVMSLVFKTANPEFIPRQTQTYTYMDGTIYQRNGRCLDRVPFTHDWIQ